MSEEQGSYIQQVHLKGYKSVKDLTVSFQKGLNIIIGANGSGKTNFMEFLDAAYGSNYERLLNNRKFEVEILANHFKVKIENETINSPSNRSEYKFKITETIENRNNNFTKNYLFDEDKKIIHTNYVNSEGINEMPFLPLSYNEILYIGFDNPLTYILKNKFSISIITWLIDFYIEEIDTEFSSSYEVKFKSDSVNIFLNRVFHMSFWEDSKNDNIYNFIDEVINKNKIVIDRLAQNLSKFSPIKDVKIDWSLTRKTVQEYEEGDSATIEGIDFQFYVNNEWLNWTQLSDGTKRLFYLIGSVTYAKENEIILMEEPELGVHPHQLTLLMNFLKAESETKQIIISTHSPQVLNCLKEDELDHIIVARHEGKAGTQMYPLSEEEKGFAAEYMKNQAFLSDYWLQSGFMNDETFEPT
jgi:predicted ATP-dependent endonuclease of OLD family